ADSNSIASLLEYSADGREDGSYAKPVVSVTSDEITPGRANIAVIGAGNFTQSTLLPALKEAGAPLKYIVSSGGLSSTQLAKKYDIEKSATDYKVVLSDDSVKGVLITTRPHLHAPMVIEALRSGKEVFVEKPLALTQNELDA